VADDRSPATAFVLGGGGILGSVEVGMLQALTERGIRPDLVVGSSVGALNGALFAADPTVETVGRLTDLWTEFSANDIFSGSLVGRISTLVRLGTHIQANESLRQLIESHLPGALIENLPVAYQCVAASIERAGPHWFSDGPVVDAVLASCAVPGLFPPVGIGGEHFYDGGLVSSIPVGRAVQLGARTVYVLHVGRIEQPLKPPRRPWEVGYVAFEIARRSRFVEDMANLPTGITVRALPSGAPLGAIRMRSRNGESAGHRIRQAYQATSEYLDALQPD
jgi:NTE family protein